MRVEQAAELGKITPKCTKSRHFELENQNIFLERGTQPLPRPFPHWGGDTPSLCPIPLGAFGASTGFDAPSENLLNPALHRAHMQQQTRSSGLLLWAHAESLGGTDGRTTDYDYFIDPARSADYAGSANKRLANTRHHDNV